MALTEQKFLQAGTGATNRDVTDKLKEFVSVKDFGAVGDGVTNDWQACQEACDYVQALGGGTVLFPPGTYRIAGNTIVIWGSNISLLGYGATLYKDNAGGSAGTFGDALTVFGKLPDLLYYSPQVAGGTYSAPELYAGALTASRNINIEGFKVTFGTHATDSINGISGVNFEHLTVKNCVVVDAPQTGFAWIATYGSNISHLTMENCLSDGAGMQGYRFNSYVTAPVIGQPDGAAGEVFAKLINCRTENTTLSVAVPWPEQDGLPSSAFVRASGSDLQFQVAFDNCQFDATTHLLDGYRTTSFRNCRLGHVYALNASPNCVLQFDNCRFREFDASGNAGGIQSQIWARNTSNEQANIVINSCTFETPAASAYSIYNRGFDIDLLNSSGLLAVYSIDWGTRYPVTSITGCRLKDPGSSANTFAGKIIELDSCWIYTPINVIQAYQKSITAKNNQFVVDASFSTYCIVVTFGNVVAEGNLIEYTNNAYATIEIAPPANTLSKKNQYLYNGGTELSADETYGTAIPTTGYWQRTSRVINSTPNVGQPKAWVCRTAGNPGTWTSEGNL